MQWMVAEMMEGVEKMGQRMAADRSSADLRHATADLQLMNMVVGMRRETGEQLGGVEQGVKQLSQQLSPLPVQLEQLDERVREVDGVVNEQLRIEVAACERTACRWRSKRLSRH